MRLVILLLSCLIGLCAQEALPPAPNIDLLWSIPRLHHESEDLLMVSWIESELGCDHFPQTIAGLWDRFVCHANHWAKLRREGLPGSYSWRALREWKLVQQSFKDLNILVKDE